MIDLGPPRRFRLYFVAACFAASLFLTAAADSVEAEGGRPVAESPAVEAKSAGAKELPQLIKDLGSSDFAERMRAEEQILRMGQDAYDAVIAAKGHPDLEIRERVRYIELRLQIDWVRPDDPLAARQLLTRYKSLNDEGRLARIAKLAGLPAGQGIGPLCRIARFDGHEAVAKRAAMALISLPDERLIERGVLARAVEVELDEAASPAVGWIRTRLVGLSDPREALAELNAAVEAELAELHERPEEVDARNVFGLVKRHLIESRDHGTPAETAAALERVVEFDVDVPDDESWWIGLLELFGSRRDTSVASLVFNEYMYETDVAPGSAALCWAIDWALKNRCDDALRILLEEEAELVAAQRGSQYLAALATRTLDGEAAGDALAEAAYDAEDPDYDECKAAADALAEQGVVAWAEREYRRIIADRPLNDYSAFRSREALAQWLHDREDFAGAANVMAELADQSTSDPETRKSIMEALEEHSARIGPARDNLSAFLARRYLYEAYEAERKGDSAAQRKLLDQAVANNPSDPDVLIAMYRLPNADAEYQRSTVDRIETTARELRDYARNVDDNPRYYAQLCNQYAWLVSNTEGDYEKALELSLASLKAAPDEPSYLDTLGRCYFAVGDVDKAVISQRRACELSPHVDVMKRQLKFFEVERAKREAK